jgi:hypothetical protein
LAGRALLAADIEPRRRLGVLGPNRFSGLARQQFDFRREVPNLFPGGGRLDWLINSQGIGGQQTAIEIKAQTHRYIRATFVADVRADVAKLATLGAGYTKIMLAAPCDDGTANILVQQDNFVPLVHFAGDAAAFYSKTI